MSYNKSSWHDMQLHDFVCGMHLYIVHGRGMTCTACTCSPSLLQTAPTILLASCIMDASASAALSMESSGRMCLGANQPRLNGFWRTTVILHGSGNILRGAVDRARCTTSSRSAFTATRWLIASHPKDWFCCAQVSLSGMHPRQKFVRCVVAC